MRSFLFVYYFFHRNVSSPLTSCLSLLLIYWTCINLLSHFPVKDLPNLAFVRCVPSYLCHDFNLIGIIIIIIIISFTQGIYTYIPETNYVPREYSVAAILLLLFMVLISLVSVLNLLYFYISTF